MSVKVCGKADIHSGIGKSVIVKVPKECERKCTGIFLHEKDLFECKTSFAYVGRREMKGSKCDAEKDDGDVNPIEHVKRFKGEDYENN